MPPGCAPRFRHLLSERDAGPYDVRLGGGIVAAGSDKSPTRPLRCTDLVVPQAVSCGIVTAWGAVMTDSLTSTSAQLSGVAAEPLSLRPQRDRRNARSGVAVGAGQQAPAEVAVAGLVRSADPRIVLTSLADKLAAMGYDCTVEVAVHGQLPVWISRSARDQREDCWDGLRTLLDTQPLVLCDGRVVGVGFIWDADTDAEAAADADGAGAGGGAGADPDAQAGDAHAHAQDPAHESEPTKRGAPGGYVGSLLARRSGGGQVNDLDAEMVHALVDYAARVVAAERLAQQVKAHRTRVERLEEALVTNREIGVAIGIVMAAQRCNAIDAFATLRAASQNGNRKVRDIAAQITYTGELPMIRTTGVAPRRVTRTSHPRERAATSSAT